MSHSTSQSYEMGFVACRLNIRGVWITIDPQIRENKAKNEFLPKFGRNNRYKPIAVK